MSARSICMSRVSAPAGPNRLTASKWGGNEEKKEAKEAKATQNDTRGVRIELQLNYTREAHKSRRLINRFMINGYSSAISCELIMVMRQTRTVPKKRKPSAKHLLFISSGGHILFRRIKHFEIQRLGRLLETL